MSRFCFRIHGCREKQGRLLVRAEPIYGCSRMGNSAHAVTDDRLELVIESISIQEPTDQRTLVGDFEPKYLGLLCRLPGRPPEALIGLEFVGNCSPAKDPPSDDEMKHRCG